MKTIKVIDLFNKMAKGEEVPKKFKYDDHIYYLQYCSGFDYCYRCDEIDDIFESSFTFEMLNDEIEIIEDAPKEESETPEKIEEREIEITMSIGEQVCANKINEIIDYLESKENNHEQ